MVARNQPSRHTQKRHGKHQKHTKDFVKIYWPYLPFVMVVLIGLVFSASWQPHARRGVLAYSTEMSISGLLSATNQQRNANGVASLNLNSKLNSAAQTKANDMVTRNYWSHNTPEGNPPWVFISNAGYSYTKAGENLAYGFATSDDTIIGWMNSPAHKANLLDSAFKDVGFGFANSPDFNNSGPQTVVVAEYAAPVAAAPAPVAAPSTPVSQPQTKAAEQTAPVAAPAPTPVAESTPTASEEKPAATQPVTTENTPTKQNEPAAKNVSRFGVLSRGELPWMSSFASIVALVGVSVFAIRHAIGVRRWIVHSERYVLHHMVFDLTIVSLVGLCLVVSQSAGVIR